MTGFGKVGGGGITAMSATQNGNVHVNTLLFNYLGVNDFGSVAALTEGLGRGLLPEFHA